MFLALLQICLISESGFQFEIDRGPLIEVVASSTVTDDEDKSSYGGGLRLSYSFANKKDFFFSFELSGSAQRFELKEPSLFGRTAKDQTKYYGLGNIMLYEFYNPMAFRFAAGGGVEKRLSKYSAVIEYRGGLGYYLNSHLGFYGDIVGRNIFRKSETSIPIELSLSFQQIF